MSIPRLMAVVVAVLALAACANALPTRESFGVVALTAGDQLPCLTFSTAATPGERVQIILLPSQQALSATVGSPIAACGFGQEPGYAYRLELELEPDGPIYGSIAVRGKAPTGVSFRECAGSEALHLSAWNGARRIWHGAFYVGYELEPDCSPDEVE